MTKLTRNLASAGLCVVLCYFAFVLWYVVASDYSDSVVSGTYRLAHDGETSTLVIEPDHSFQQELSRSGRLQRAQGSWRRLGQGGIAFSKEFLRMSGQELSANGTAYGDIHKTLGFLVSLTLTHYHVEWYGRVDPSPDNVAAGTYVGDEEGVSATLILKADHTFEQAVSHQSVESHAKGSWSTSQNGDIMFSKAFLKASGEALAVNETASSLDPKGPNLQIEVAATSKSGAPTFQKKQFSW
jgi:hypothetical protein